MRTLLITFFCFTCLSISAQNSLSDRIYFGGGFGLSANSNQLNVSLSPQVGYKITPKYSAGVGIIYQYVGIQQPKLTINNYGWNVFNRFNITEKFFAYGEFEKLYFEYFTSFSPERREREVYNSLLIGGGFSEQLSGKASFSFTALYNVLYDPLNAPQPYNSPWVIRAGFGVNLF